MEREVLTKKEHCPHLLLFPVGTNLRKPQPLTHRPPTPSSPPMSPTQQRDRSRAPDVRVQGLRPGLSCVLAPQAQAPAPGECGQRS